jgi:hypothetical protein
MKSKFCKLCGKRRRQGQRLCRDCHADYMRRWREKKAKYWRRIVRLLGKQDIKRARLVA